MFNRYPINIVLMALLTLASVPLQAIAQDKPVATTDAERPGVRLEVTELSRSSGDTLTLKFTIINESDEGLDFGHEFGDPSIGSDYGSIGGTHLIDNEGQKKYLVLRDEDQKCVCSSDLSSVEAGSSLNLWAKFPAPPGDVKQVSIVVPHFIPMDDVPISE
jgi:hypothetical protein